MFTASFRSATLLAIVILLVVFGLARAQPDPVKPLVVGSEEDYPPFAIGKTDETASGFTVDLWKTVAAESGLSYVFRVRPFRQLLEEFKAGKIDVMINLAQSKERQTFANFSVPHVIVHGAIFVRHGETRMRSEADLAGKSIIVLSSDLAHDYAISRGWKHQLVLVDTAAEGLTLLASGQHDAMLLSKLAGMQTLVERKIRNVTTLEAKAGFSQRFSFAVQKEGASDLLAKINEGLALTKSTGTYDALYEKWFGVFEAKEVTFQQILKYLGPITLVFVVILGFLLVRQNARRKVEAAHAQLAAIVENSHEAIFSRTLDGTILSWNAGAEKMFGYSAAEVIGKSTSVLVPPDRQLDFSRHNERLLRGEVVTHESNRLTRAGRMITVINSLSPIKDSSGNITGVSVILQDITERKRAEVALRESEQNLTITLNSIGDAVIATDDAGLITRMNPAAERLTGWPLVEAAGHSLSEVFNIINTQTRAPCVNPVQIVMERGEVVGLANHTALLSRDGREYQIADSAAPIRGTDGDVLGVVLVFNDITERYQGEAERAHFEAIVEHSNDAIVSRGLDGILLSWNPAAERLFGWSATEAVGNHISIFIPPGHEAEVRRNVEKLNRGEFVAAYDTVRRKKSGQLFDVELTQSPISNARGEVTAISLLFRDITERKAAEAARLSLEAQLRESQKMEAIGTLAGGIAHDFNNALATILGNAELAREDSAGNPPALESLEEIRKAGVRARDLVQQILAFSRRQSTERKRIDLAPVVMEAARLLRATLPARLSLDVQCDEVLPVQADASQLLQVLINLTTNAMQAMPSGAGRIGIRLDSVILDAALVDTHLSLKALHAQHPGRTVRLTVSDTGPGMDTVTLERIFEPFFTTRPVGKGTGLGLSVVHGIVQNHGGTIVVQSQPGQGSSFTIYLPLAELHPGSPEPDGRIMTPTRAMTLGGGRHILYLDDDEALVKLVKRLLERRGYRVSSYTNQNEALAALRAEPAAFDLVVTDYNMPGLSGLDVASAVREIRAQLPVALTSGFIDETLSTQAQVAGVRELIFKADTVEVYCATIQRLVDAIGEQAT